MPIDAAATPPRRCSSRAAAARSSPGPASGSRTANSSPPRRPSTSEGRRSAASVGRDGAQEVVAGGVAAGVVDALEVVEVEHDQPERAAVVAHVVGELGREALGEAAAVERAGQRVRARERLQLAALALAVDGLGDAHDRRGGQDRGEDGERLRRRVAAEQRGAEVPERRTGRRWRPPTAADRRAPRRTGAGRTWRAAGSSRRRRWRRRARSARRRRWSRRGRTARASASA